VNDKTLRQNEREDILSLMYGDTRHEQIQAKFERDIVERKKNDTEIFCDYSYYLFGNVGIHTTNKLSNTLCRICKNAVGENREITKLILIPLFDKAYRNLREKIESKQIPLKTNLSVRAMIGELKAHIANKETTDREYKIYLYLALVTGRRFVELLQTLKITEDEGQVIYTGVLKKGDIEKEVFGYFLGEDSVEYVNTLLQELQSPYKRKTQKQLSALQRRFALGIFRASGGAIRAPHDCRHLFLLEMIESGQVAMHEGEGDEQYRRRLLGHQIASDSTRGYIKKFELIEHDDEEADSLELPTKRRWGGFL